MINRVRFILIITVLSNIYYGSISLAYDAAFLDAESLINGWKAQYGEINRMQFKLSEKVVDSDESQEDSKELEGLIKFRIGELIVDKETKRFHLKYSREEGGLDNPLNIYESAFDGNITKDYWGDNPLKKRGRIASGRRNSPNISEQTLEKYLLNFNVGYTQQDGEFNWVPLMDQLIELSKMDNYSMVVKQNIEIVSNEPCHVIEVRKDGKPGVKIWFAHNKGMLPMKYQSFSSSSDVTEEIVVTETSKVETETGIMWYPSKAHHTQPISKNDDSGNLLDGKITYELEVFKFIPNVEIDESTFQFEFPLGTEVRDEVAGNLDYTVGSPNPGSSDYVIDKQNLENIRTLETKQSDQTSVVQNDIVTNADLKINVEEASLKNVINNDLQANSNKKIIRNILYLVFLVCSLVSIVILVKCKKAKEND